jgi:hypothetical protein
VASRRDWILAQMQDLGGREYLEELDPQSASNAAPARGRAVKR